MSGFSSAHMTEIKGPPFEMFDTDQDKTDEKSCCAEKKKRSILALNWNARCLKEIF